MGAQVSRTQTQVEQYSSAELYNNFKTECNAQLSNKVENLTINLAGSNVGNITIAQNGTADAACIIQNGIKQLAETIFNEVQTSTASSKSFNLGFKASFSKSTSITEIEQVIQNNIDNLCSSTVDNYVGNVTYNISTSTTGNIEIIQTGQVQSVCAVSNIGEMTSKVDVDTQIDTTAGKSKFFGGDAIWVFAFVIIVVAVIGMIGSIFGNFGNDSGLTEDELSDEAKENGCLPYPCDGKTGDELKKCQVQFPRTDAYCPVKDNSPIVTVEGIEGMPVAPSTAYYTAQSSYPSSVPSQGSYPSSVPSQGSYSSSVPGQGSYSPSQGSYPSSVASQGSYPSSVPSQGSYSSSVPSQGSYSSPPSQGSYSSPPSQGSYSSPPSQGNYSSPPSQGSYSSSTSTVYTTARSE